MFWDLLFKCSKIGFGTAMEFGDTWQNVMAARWDVQVNPILTHFIQHDHNNMTRQSRHDYVADAV